MNDSNQSGSVLNDPGTKMRCGMFTNANGDILIIYDQEITFTVQWIEYDETEGSFVLINEDGDTQSLGLQLDQKAKQNIRNSNEATLVYIQNGTIKSSQKMVIIIR